MSARDAPIKHGYTLADLDAMARQACAADRSLASDVRTRYDVAWSAIALALVEAPHWPRRETLVRVGWRAIYDEVRQMRHTYGFRDKDGTQGAASSPRFQEYWWSPTYSFEDHVVERLALGPILATLTESEHAAVTALAVTDDYRAAAAYLGIKDKAFQRRLDMARRKLLARWYYPDRPPTIRHTDRRVGAHGRQLVTHCAAGHEWTLESTRWRKSGPGRDCRICERERSRVRAVRRRQQREGPEE